MTENLTSNNSQNGDSNLNCDKSDYKNLINRLKEIKTTINLLEKIIFK